MIRPHRHAILAAGLYLVVVALASRYGLGGALVVPGAFLAFVVLIDLIRGLRRSRPIVRIDGPKRANLRIPTELQLASSRSGLLALNVPWQLGGPCDLVALAGGAVSSLTVVPKRRGRHLIDEGWFFEASPWKLWWRKSIIEVGIEVDVYPDILGDDRSGAGLESGVIGRSSRLGMLQVSSELRSLRYFHSGDDPRHVDWKSTARRMHPVVRDWEPERRRSVVVVIDAGRFMRAESRGESKFDAALRLLTRVAHTAARNGDYCGAAIYRERLLRFIPPLHGAAQAATLLSQVNDIEPESQESELGAAVPRLLHESRRSLVMVVTDVFDGRGARGLISAASRLQSVHLPLVVLLKDPALDGAFALPIETEFDAYLRSSAELTDRERGRAVDELRARGVPTIDTSMANVGLDGVRAYVRARSTQLA